jgi:uncharacterized protein YceK
MRALGAHVESLKFLVVLFISVLSGCSIVVHDKSNHPIAQSFVGSYYQTVKDGFLYEARCADIDATYQSTEWCIGLQAFDLENKYSNIPADYQTYKNSQEKFDEKLFTKLAFEKQRSITKPIPKGTIIQITRLVQYPWGTNGYYWAIRANIYISEESNLEVELPTNRILAYPTWLQGHGVRELPTFNREFLTECTNEKCT